jgi:hypothetical protein
MKDIHYDYTVDEIKKNLILLENHLKNYPCSECMSKHLSTIEGLAEEGTLFSDDEKEKLKFLKLAEWARSVRKSLGEIKHVHPLAKEASKENFINTNNNILISNKGEKMVKEIYRTAGSQFVGRAIQEGEAFVPQLATPIVGNFTWSSAINVFGGLGLMLGSMRGWFRGYEDMAAIAGSKLLVDELVDLAKTMAPVAPTFIPRAAPAFTPVMAPAAGLVRVE